MALGARGRAARLHQYGGAAGPPEGTKEGAPANPVRMIGPHGIVLKKQPVPTANSMKAG